MPKVSVIIPVYGVEQYIERCANSLFSQTLDDIEFIFVDDCSPDRSMELLNKTIEINRPRFAEMNWQVRTVRRPANSGLAAVRWHGIQLATGEYIIHCDSDDWVDKDMYRLMYEKAISELADIVVCDFIETNGKSSKAHRGCFKEHKDSLIYDCCSMRTSWSLWNKLVKAELYKSNITYPKGNMGEDMVLSLQVLLKAKRIGYTPHPLYYYYINPSSITRINSVESCLQKYEQNKSNAEIVLKAFQEASYKCEAMDVLKWNVRKQLWGLIHMTEYRQMWFETYPELDRILLWSSAIPLLDKLKYLLTLIHMYPRTAARIYPQG